MWDIFSHIRVERLSMRAKPERALLKDSMLAPSVMVPNSIV